MADGDILCFVWADAVTLRDGAKRMRRNFFFFCSNKLAALRPTNNIDDVRFDGAVRFFQD